MRVKYIPLVFAAFLVTNVKTRAVNISSAWMLPEEGFPVFYRYFRDRISWSEADAVCQFHHANLVTVDTTSQYDAIRAYLKELDIANHVWIGLSRPIDKSNFMWRNFRELSAPDYWQEAIPAGGGEPLCAAMDPAADFRWHALTCGSPEAASFICELPVPTWASGCLITELPSLTVLYIPEQSAVELTSDCGLDGTKRIVCKGKGDRDELIRRLACTSDEGIATTTVVAQSVPTAPSAKTTKPLLIWTSNTIDTGDYAIPTRHRRETEETSASLATGSTTEIPATLGTSSQRPDGANQEDFASAINQGQLFSIIENGTMFDIIELNGTDENKTLAPDHQTTSHPIIEQRALYTHLTKEALPDPPMPAAEGTDLHRTFRKQVPTLRKLKPAIDNDVNNDIASVIVTAVIQIARAAEEHRIDVTGNEPATITSHKPRATSLPPTDDSKYESEPTAKPNRQRQLTRSNRRSFYPYFFSRVLG